MSTQSTLVAKTLWTPNPTLANELRTMVSNVVDKLPPLHCEEPIDGEQYLWSNDILDRLQDYAFTQGFAVVTLSGPQAKGRMRFGCIHDGKARI